MEPETDWYRYFTFLKLDILCPSAATFLHCFINQNLKKDKMHEMHVNELNIVIIKYIFIIFKNNNKYIFLSFFSFHLI